MKKSSTGYVRFIRFPHWHLHSAGDLFCISKFVIHLQTWESLVQASAEESIDQSLSLLVHFKLRVHFAVYHLTSDADPQTKSHSMGRLTSFLQENGTKYSKFPELAPYFAIPYIRDNADHPLLADIRKVKCSACGSR